MTLVAYHLLRINRSASTLHIVITDVHLRAIDGAAIGVLGHVTRLGRPNALAVTPYVVDGRLLVTSTLALIDKAAALRLDPRVTLTAGGVAVSGTACVEVDTSPAFFDRSVRRQELMKYPPARSLLSIPCHRRLLPWYVGRVAIWIEPNEVAVRPATDDTTVTVVDERGHLVTTIIERPDDLDADVLRVGEVPSGPAVLLVHAEDTAMRDLRQLGRHGRVVDGALHVERRRGSLASHRTGTLDELRTLRALAAKARANRAQLATWPPIGSPSTPKPRRGTPS